MIVGGETATLATDSGSTGWTNGSIDISVPSAAVSGYAQVYVNAYGSNIVNVNVGIPVITSFSVPYGPVGATLVIGGQGFGQQWGTVTVGGHSATVTKWSQGSISILIPSVGVGTSPTSPTVPEQIVVTSYVKTSSIGSQFPNPFIVTPPPVIESELSTVILEEGLATTIQCLYCSLNQGSVSLNGTTINVSDWNNNCGLADSITTLVCFRIQVPAAATSGTLSVSTFDTVQVNAQATVYFPAFYTPLDGPPSTEERLDSLPLGSELVWATNPMSGTDFGQTPGQVYWQALSGGKQYPLPFTWGINQMICYLDGIPTLVFGYIYVIRADGVSAGPQGLEANAAPIITSADYSQNIILSGYSGPGLVITGTNFGQSSGALSLNGVSLPISASSNSSATELWTNGSIVIPILPTYSSGSIVVTAQGGISSSPFTADLGPVIVAASPTSAPIGTFVTLTGYRFSQNDTLTVQDAVANGQGMTFTYPTVPFQVVNGEIQVTIPTSLTNPPDPYNPFWILTDTKGYTSTLGYTIGAAPLINLVTPASGTVGTPITITGSNLGSPGTVSFNGMSVSGPPYIQSWVAGKIVVNVPPGATTGPIQIFTGVVASPSNTEPFTVIPSISSLTPASGAVGTVIQINGAGFTSPVVYINGNNQMPSTWSPLTLGVISATVPSNLNLSIGTSYSVTVSNGSGTTSSAPASFLVTGPPTINTLPTSGYVGSSVTITGTNFGSAPGSVTFNGVAATTFTMPWSATSLTVLVPAGATTGPVVVTAQGGVSSTSNPTFTVLPHILSLSPSAGPNGNSLLIHGTTFGTSCSATVGGASVNLASPNSCTDLLITTTVPSTAPTGAQNVIVTTGSGQSNPFPFTVGLTPTITNILPIQAAATNIITISGGNFGTQPGQVNFTQGSTQSPITIPVTVTSANWDAVNGVITVSVPNGLAVGPVNIQVVDNGGNQVSPSYPYIIAPGITSLSLPQGPPQMGLQINGSGFGTSSAAVTVTLSNFGSPLTMSIIGSPADALISVQVPSTATTSTGPQSVSTETITVTVNGVTSSPAYFEVVTPFDCPI